MNVILRFDDPISDACKEKLQTFMDDVLAQGLTANRPPQIEFSGVNGETSFKLDKLRHDYDARLNPLFRYI